MIGLVTWRHLRGSNANAWFTAGLHPRLLTCCLPTAALIGTEPLGIVLVAFCGLTSGPDGDRGKIYWIRWMGRIEVDAWGVAHLGFIVLVFCMVSEMEVIYYSPVKTVIDYKD